MSMRRHHDRAISAVPVHRHDGTMQCAIDVELLSERQHARGAGEHLGWSIPAWWIDSWFAHLPATAW